MASSGSAVVGPQYCSPQPTELLMNKKVFARTALFSVNDVSNDDLLLFRVDSKPFSRHDKRVLLDAAGNPILTLSRKLWSFRSTWKAYRGESSDPSQLVFTVKHPLTFLSGRKLKVYLADNTSQQFCDFKIKKSFFGGSCVFYAGESSSAVVAQMQEKVTAGSIFLGKDRLMVSVYPNVDQALIVSLIVILDAIETSARRNSSS